MTSMMAMVASATATAAALALPALPSAAQKRDPLDARAPVPAVVHGSAFEGYRPLGDDRLGWKEANDQVGRIGGWRAYLREAQEPDAAAPPDAAASAPASAAAPRAATSPASAPTAADGRDSGYGGSAAGAHGGPGTRSGPGAGTDHGGHGRDRDGGRPGKESR